VGGRGMSGGAAVEVGRSLLRVLAEAAPQCPSAAQVLYSTVLYITAQYSKTQYSTEQCSMVQCTLSPARLACELSNCHSYSSSVFLEQMLRLSLGKEPSVSALFQEEVVALLSAAPPPDPRHALSQVGSQTPTKGILRST